MGLAGDKNSPKTSQTSTSTTTNTQIQPQVSAGAGSGVSVGPTLSEVANTGKIDITTTDQGAVQAGLAVALKALDTAGSSTTSAIQAGNQAQDAAINVAQGVAQGQSNQIIQYVLYAAVGIAAIYAAIKIFGKKG
jgi:hypothetical protein